MAVALVKDGFLDDLLNVASIEEGTKSEDRDSSAIIKRVARACLRLDNLLTFNHL